MRQRRAIKRATEIVAECPIDGTCANRIDGGKEWQNCGHYDGSVRTRKGTWINCRYEEQRT
jgi:hypothetical protein